ncbi:MAG: hypothetical protein WCO07_01525 [bacterium]
MLVICISCGRIIGCSVKNTIMTNKCITCDIFKECRDAIPKDSQGTATVMLVHFEHECLDHDRTMIGFHPN